MKNKLIVRLSNNLGNQMFMYASAYVFAKKLNRDFFYDDETAYQSSNLYKYNLDIFKISSTKAPNNLKFLNKSGYIKRKFLKYFDNFYSSKMFYVEPRDRNKNTSFNGVFIIISVLSPTSFSSQYQASAASFHPPTN